MLPKRAKLLIVALTLLPSLASAEDWPPFSAERAASPQYRQCVARDPSNANESNCLVQEYARQKMELEFAYRDNLKGRSAVERAQIVKAQLAWAAFRDANCKVRSMNPGSGAAIFYYGCLVRETITRRSELMQNWDY